MGRLEHSLGSGFAIANTLNVAIFVKTAHAKKKINVDILSFDNQHQHI